MDCLVLRDNQYQLPLFHGLCLEHVLFLAVHLVLLSYDVQYVLGQDV